MEWNSALKSHHWKNRLERIYDVCLLLLAIPVYVKWKEIIEEEKIKIKELQLKKKMIEEQKRKLVEEERQRKNEEEERKRKVEKIEQKLVDGIMLFGVLLAGYTGYKVWKAVTGNGEPNSQSSQARVIWRRPPPVIEAKDWNDDSEDSTPCQRPALAFPRSLLGSSESWERRLKVCDIGVNFDEWRIPKKLSVFELLVAQRICDASRTELNIDEDEWNKATGAVNRILTMLMTEIICDARKYGLFVEKYVKQGSSREGLKVHDADEFDVLLQYHFENLDYKVVNISLGGKILPELACLRLDTHELCELSYTHPRLYKKNVFEQLDSNVYVNARQLHEKVFKSMIAAASAAIEKKVNQGEHRDKFGFKINLSTNPPSENIRIKLIEKDDEYTVHDRLDAVFQEFGGEIMYGRLQGYIQEKETIINVDIVPGLLLSEDIVPDPVNKYDTMLCPTYAVFKWRTENDRSASRYGANPELLWRVCSSGYEKHVIDVARGKREQLHILNALRIMKLHFRNMKQNAKDRNEPPPQVVTVLRSYHLKHIAFYCILFLRILNKVEVSDMKVALSYMLAFLGVCLEERKLPHFFQANKHICHMFPNMKLQLNTLRYDLFQGKRADSLIQAMLSYQGMKERMFGIISESIVSDYVIQLFRTYVSSGNYY